MVDPETHAMKILDAKAEADREWDKLKNLPPWDASEVRDTKRRNSRSPSSENSSPLRDINAPLPPEAFKVGNASSNTQDELCFEGTMSKTNQDAKMSSASYLAFPEWLAKQTMQSPSAHK